MFANCRVLIGNICLKTCRNNPQLRPLVAISFNISAAKNRSNELGSTTPLVLIAASGEDFVTPSGGNDERFVATRLNTIVDRDIPLAKRCADGLNFSFDGRFDGREDHPTLVGGEGAGGGVLAEKAHLPTAQGQSPPQRQTRTAQQPTPHERQPLPRGCRLCIKIGDVASERKTPRGQSSVARPSATKRAKVLRSQRQMRAICRLATPSAKRAAMRRRLG